MHPTSRYSSAYLGLLLAGGWLLVACSAPESDGGNWRLGDDTGPISRDTGRGDLEHTDDTHPEEPDGETSQTHSCRGLRGAPVDESFRKVEKGRWRRRLPSTEQDCGVYRPVLELIQAEGHWGLHVSYELCNRCDSSAFALYADRNTGFGLSEVGPRPISGNMEPPLMLGDERGRRFPLGCDYRKQLRELDTLRSHSRGPLEARKTTTVQTTYQPLMKFLWDGRDRGDSLSPNDYYESPVDYGSLEMLHLWWFRFLTVKQLKASPWPSPWPETCEVNDGFNCLTQFLQLCETHGFDVPNFETNVSIDSYMFRQTVSFDSFPPPVQKQLERRQRRASE